MEFLDEFWKKQLFDIEWDIQDMLIFKGMEDYLFRIVQEVFLNVFRYLKVLKVFVILGVKNNQFWLKVIDNGKGFKMDQVKVFLYGLNFMKECVSEIGGVVEVILVEGKGI